MAFTRNDFSSSPFDSLIRRPGTTHSAFLDAILKPSPNLVQRAEFNNMLPSSSTTSRPAPRRVAPKPAPRASSSGFGGGGGGGSIAAPARTAKPPKPKPMRDVDWFNADPIYKGEAGRSLADLTSQLAQIMADRDAGFQQLGNSRDDLAHDRKLDLTGTANDAASRGVLASGLFAQQVDQVATNYARQGTQLDQVQAQLQQQYGNPGTKVDLSQLAAGAKNGSGNLNSIYGLLGALGLNAGNAYQNAIGQAKAASAARAAAPLISTFK